MCPSYFGSGQLNNGIRGLIEKKVEGNDDGIKPEVLRRVLITSVVEGWI